MLSKITVFSAGILTTHIFLCSLHTLVMENKTKKKHKKKKQQLTFYYHLLHAREYEILDEPFSS